MKKVLVSALFAVGMVGGLSVESVCSGYVWAMVGMVVGVESQCVSGGSDMRLGNTVILEAIPKGESLEEAYERALREYERAHAVWFNRPIWDNARELEVMTKTRLLCDRARKAWVEGGMVNHNVYRGETL